MGYHRIPNGGPIMSANVMPPLEMDAESKCEVEAWVRITTEGDIYFYRRTPSADLQVSEMFPRAALPRFVSVYYPAVFFIPEDLTVPTRASIVHRGSHLPEDMSGILPTDLEVLWHLEEAELADEHTYENAHEDQSNAGEHTQV